MKAKRLTASAFVVIALLGLTGCSGMTARERDTAIGAGVGGVAGNLIGGGSVLGTAAGAVAGGVIGHEVSKNR